MSGDRYRTGDVPLVEGEYLGKAAIDLLLDDPELGPQLRKREGLILVLVEPVGGINTTTARRFQTPDPSVTGLVWVVSNLLTTVRLSMKNVPVMLEAVRDMIREWGVS